METHRNEEETKKTQERSENQLQNEEDLKDPPENHEEKETDFVEEEVMEDLSSMNPSLVQDHNFVKNHLPRAAILTLTKEYITVVIM
jgi:hypothetical protein